MYLTRKPDHEERREIDFICLFLLLGCKTHGVVKIDYEQAIGTIIGQEKCSVTEENAWILSIYDSLSIKSYGSPIVYNGVKYPHALKSYGLDLTSESANSSKVYLFEFHNVDNPPSTICDELQPEVYSAPIVTLQKAIPRAD